MNLTRIATADGRTKIALTDLSPDEKQIILRELEQNLAHIEKLRENFAKKWQEQMTEKHEGFRSWQCNRVNTYKETIHVLQHLIGAIKSM